MAPEGRSIPLALVAAVAKNGVIGDRGKLAWRISDDLKWFKAMTLGKPVIMGRKTFAAIGGPLPGRDNIVVTRSPVFAAEGVLVARGPEPALALARECASKRGAGEICIIGGGEIYAALLPCADRIYLTRVDAVVTGDAYFPEIDPLEWAERRESTCAANERNQHACEFFILDRRRS